MNYTDGVLKVSEFLTGVLYFLTLLAVVVFKSIFGLFQGVRECPR